MVCCIQIYTGECGIIVVVYRFFIQVIQDGLLYSDLYRMVCCIQESVAVYTGYTDLYRNH
jgi:hypothetical protein